MVKEYRKKNLPPKKGFLALKKEFLALKWDFKA